MKKTTFTLFMLLGVLANAQKVASFEKTTLGADSHIDGSDGTTLVSEEGIDFPVQWDTTWGFWSGGWGISNKTDSTRRDMDGLFQSITGSGHESNTYLVGQEGSGFSVENSTTSPLMGFYITNTSYAYHSMADGDFFAKKFGGASGNDPDYLLLNILGKKNGQWLNDTIHFYLADFRFADNTQDFIVSDWRWVDLEALEGADSLYFTYQSSDTGEWGINTPTFFVADHFVRQFPSSLQKTTKQALNIYPNPASSLLNLSITTPYQILNSTGMKVLEGEANQIDVSSIPPGVYFLRSSDDQSTRFIKQ